MNCVKELKIDLKTALKMTTSNPSRAMKLPEKFGFLKVN